jgi:hypothetical protein
MAESKTRVNDASVDKFLQGFPESIQKDCYRLIEMMKKATKQEAEILGTTIIGFGKYHYKSASGREGDYFLAGFSPRKQNPTP